MDYIHVTIKLMIGITYAIMIMKWSGKGNLAPLSPFDQINNYILGGIVGSVLFNKSIQIIDFIFVLTIWGILTLSITYLRKKSAVVRSLIDGQAIDVIENGKIIRSGIEKAKINLPDLYLKLKIQNVYDIKTISRATIEQNGQVTFISKSNDDNTIIPLIIDKVVYFDNLKHVGCTVEKLEQFVKINGFNSFDDIAGIEWNDGSYRIIEFI
ncbi:DUF421 domain-containing protein [Erysipelothrix urinaevulpis]|uniref:DUF421 domain-containing protein n=1 Tax=Erysipelothrix urinaevulpis TaxID=2683717 RepID=UPI001358627B|nr:YetF domain-containing protein [Erysipelothrix urinaevulpis]